MMRSSLKGFAESLKLYLGKYKDGGTIPIKEPEAEYTGPLPSGEQLIPIDHWHGVITASAIRKIRVHHFRSPLFPGIWFAGAGTFVPLGVGHSPEDARQNLIRLIQMQKHKLHYHTHKALDVIPLHIRRDIYNVGLFMMYGKFLRADNPTGTGFGTRIYCHMLTLHGQHWMEKKAPRDYYYENRNKSVTNINGRD